MTDVKIHKQTEEAKIKDKKAINVKDESDFIFKMKAIDFCRK